MKSKTPQLRFKGFDEVWDQTHLSQYLTTSTLKNKDNTFAKEDVLSVSREFGVVNQMEFQGRSFAGASLLGYGVASNRDIIYTKSPLRDQPYGIIKTNKGEAGIVSALYAIYSPKDNIDPDFIQVYFDDDERLNNYLRPIVRKGAKNTLNVSDDDALSGNVVFPQKVEQSMMAKMFCDLDDRITKQNSKCQKLLKLKDCLIESLFIFGEDSRLNSKNEAFPLRMTGDNVFAPVSEKGYPELPILSASQELGMIPRAENGIDMSYGTANIDGYKRVLPNQFVIHLRSFQGGFAHSSIEGITSPAYTVMRFKEPEKQDPVYWKYLLTSAWFVKELAKVTYGIRDGKSIKFDDFAKMEFCIPEKDKQHEIAEILEELSDLIRLNNQKLEKLRQLKSALLDIMFV